MCATAELLLQGLRHLDAAAHDDNIDIVGETLKENVTHIAANNVALYTQTVSHMTYLVEDVLV